MRIYTLEQLRDIAPAELKEVSDEQLIVEYAKDTQQDPFAVANYLGVETGADRGDFMAGLSSGVDVVQGLGYSALAAGAEALGYEDTADEFMRDAQGQQAEAYLAGKPQLDRVENVDSLQDAADYFQYQLGRGLPMIAAIAAPTIATGGSALGLAATGALSYGTGVGSLYGSAYDAYEQDGQRPDSLEVFGKAVPYAVAESLVPLGLGKLARATTGSTTAALAGGGKFARTVKGGLGGFVTEASTELAQTELEIGMNPYLSEDEKFSQRLNAAVAGGITGGTLSAATNLVAGPRAEKTRETGVEGTDLTEQTAQVQEQIEDTAIPTDETIATEVTGVVPEVETQQETTVEPEVEPTVQQAEEGVSLTEPTQAVESPIKELEVKTTNKAGNTVTKLSVTDGTGTETIYSISKNPEGKTTAVKQLDDSGKKATRTFTRRALLDKTDQEIVSELSGVPLAVNQPVAQQEAVQEPSSTEVEKAIQEFMDAQDALASADKEVAKLDIGTLPAQVRVTGEVSMPAQKLAATARMFTSLDADPDTIIYQEGTANPDAEMTAAETESLRGIYEAGMAMADRNRAYYDLSNSFIKTSDTIEVLEEQRRKILDNEGPSANTSTIDGKLDAEYAKLNKVETDLANAKVFRDNAVQNFVKQSGGIRNAKAIMGAVKKRSAKLQKGSVDVDKAATAEKAGKFGKSPFDTQRDMVKSLDALMSEALDNKVYDVPDFGASGKQNRTISERKKNDLSTLEKMLGVEQPGGQPTANGLQLIQGLKNAAGDKVLGMKRGGMRNVQTKAILAAIARVFRSTGVAPRVEFLGTDTKGKLGEYDPNTNTIKIRRAASDEEVVHELLHAATQWAVINGLKDGNPDIQSVVDDVKESMLKLFQYVGSDHFKNAKIPKRVKKDVENITEILAKLAKKDETSAVLELIAYGNTSRSLMQVLADIKQEPSSGAKEWRQLFDKVTSILRGLQRVIKRTLGVTDTALNVVSDSSIRIMDAVLEQEVSGIKPSVADKAPTLNMAVAHPEYDATQFEDVNAIALSNKGVLSRFVRSKLFFGMFGPIAGGVKRFGAVSLDKISDFLINNDLVGPTLSKVAGGIYSNVGTPKIFRDSIAKAFKTTKNSAFIVAERISEYMEEHSPQTIAAMFKYLDGDVNALNSISNTNRREKLRLDMDSLKSQFIKLVDRLPEGDSAKAMFDYENRLFSEMLLYVESETDIVTHTMGNKKVSGRSGKKRYTEETIDGFKDWLNDQDGNFDINARMYQVLLKDDTGAYVHHGFVNADVADSVESSITMGMINGNPNHKIVRETYYKVQKYGKKGYVFSGYTNLDKGLSPENAKSLVQAFRNTMGALTAHTATIELYSDLANAKVVTDENGQQIMTGTVFDSYAEINEYYGREVFDPEKSDQQNGIPEVTDRLLKSSAFSALREHMTFVRVPDDPAYGDIAGKIIPGRIWAALNDMNDRQPLLNVTSIADAMRFFKKTKTTWNPGTHVTNIMSNLVLMYMHGISHKTVTNAGRLLLKYEIKASDLTNQERALLNAFFESGAVLGNYSSTETKNQFYQARVEAMRKHKGDSPLENLETAINAKTNMLKRIKGGAKIMEEAYAAEDNVFRFAAFMEKAAEYQAAEGTDTMTEEQMLKAGIDAREMFLDYDIDAKWVRALRESAIPFISYPYAVTRALGRLVVEKPWQVANVMAIAYVIDLAMSELAGDDEERRKNLPKEFDQRVFGIGPNFHMRIPFLGDSENAYYYGVGHYFPLASALTPAGDRGIFGQNWWPSGLIPGGPIVDTFKAVIMGVHPFTGKSLHNPSDTNLEKLGNLSAQFVETFNIPLIDKLVVDPLSAELLGTKDPFGKTISGRERPNALYIAKALGFRIGEHNDHEELMYRDLEYKRLKREYSIEKAKIKREALRASSPDLEAMYEKLQEIEKRLYDKYLSIYKLEDE